MTPFFTAALSVTILCVAHAQAQNIIVNGSFEVGVGGTSSLRAGSNQLTGWTISGTRSLYWVQPHEFNALPAAHGTNYVDLNGAGGDIVLSQSFATVPGETYEAAFSVGLFQGFNYSVTAEVLSSNGVVLTNVTSHAPTNRGWASPTKLRFVATTPESTLLFRDTTGTVNYDLTLDAVSVERVTPRLTIECSQVRVCWESVTNATYRLQFLSNNAWADLGGPMNGTGQRECTVQPVSEPQRLYRVVRLP